VRIIIECPERILHLEAGYIYADCPSLNFKPLAVRRWTIHLRQQCVDALHVDLPLAHT